MDGKGVFNVPFEVISRAQLSKNQIKLVESKLRRDLKKVQDFQMKVLHENVASDDILLWSPDAHLRKLSPASKNIMSLNRRPGRSKSVMMVPLTTNKKSSSASSIKQCQALLNRLLRRPDAWIFGTPVDPVKLRIPTYYQIIRNPMDLGTISNKIDKNSYSSPWEFASDVRLTFTNAMTFNPPGHYVHTLANSFNKFFESEWTKIEKKLLVVDENAKRNSKSKKPTVHSNIRKASNIFHGTDELYTRRKKVSIEDKRKLLDSISHLKEIPKFISDPLERHKVMAKTSNGSNRLNISCLSDDIFFEMKKLLDTFLSREQPGQEAKPGPYDMKIRNGAEVSSPPMQSSLGNELTDEEVDIVGDDSPTSQRAALLTDNDVMPGSVKFSSSTSSSSSSKSHSSYSTSFDSSSGSDSDDEVYSTKNTEVQVKNSEAPDQKKSCRSDLFGKNNAVSSNSLCSLERSGRTESEPVRAFQNGEGVNLSIEKHTLIKKLSRDTMLKGQIDDIIPRACKETLDQGEMTDLKEDQYLELESQRTAE